MLLRDECPHLGRRIEWIPDSEVLTPTMKLKRRGVVARYADDIEALYRREPAAGA